MEVHSYIPHPALQDAVLQISTVKAILPEGCGSVVSPYPPTPFPSLLFYGNNPVSMRRDESHHFTQQAPVMLVGPQYSRVNIRVEERLLAIRVDFLPGGLYRLLGIPLHEFFDGGYDARDIFGPAMKSLNEALQQLSSLEQGKNLVENFLLRQSHTLRSVRPLDQALRLLLDANGNMPVEKTASLSCLSLKQFERKCRDYIGMNPKTYARILRFSKAYRLHEAHPHLSWIKIAYEAGYFDQMHMIRDFKTFAGVNPSLISQELLSTPIRMQKDLPG